MANSKDNIKKYAQTFIGFDEASGDVYDSIGSFAATAFNNPPRVNGWNGEGYAIQFNGTNQYVQFTTTVLKVGNKTIRFKIKTTDVSGCIMSVGRSTSGNTNYTNGIALIVTDGKLKLNSYVNTESVYSSVLTDETINDGEWHDVAVMIKDGAANIYVDGVLLKSGEFIEPTEYSNVAVGNLSVGRLNVAGFENYLAGQLDSIEIYYTEISIIPDKYLILHNNEYKYHDGITWQATTATEENFVQFGMEQLSQITEAQWDELGEDVSIAMWSDFEDKEYINVVLERDEFTPKDIIGDEYSIQVLRDSEPTRQQLVLDAVGQSQTVYPISDISLFGIKEITSLTINGVGNGRVAISTDNGATWNYFDGTTWNVVSEISQGMDFTTFNSLTDAQVKGLLGESKFIRFAYYLDGSTDIESVVMKVSTEGTPEFANKDDYDFSYDQVSKTVTYVINKSGQYIINYNDVE